MQKFLQVEVVGRQQNLGRFWGGVIGTPVFFASTTAVVMLRVHCASDAHPLRIHCTSNHFGGVKTTLLTLASKL